MATSKDYSYSKLSTDEEMDKSCDAPGESGGSPTLSAEGNATNSKSSNWLKISKDVFLPIITNTKPTVIASAIIGALVLTVVTFVNIWLVVYVWQLHDQLQIVSARQCNCNYTSVMDGYEIEKEDIQVHMYNNSASISSLWLAIENETQNRKNDFIKLTENVSELTDQVVVIKKRLQELEMNVSHFENTFLEQVQNLTSVQENLNSDFSESLAHSVSALNTSIQGVSEELVETNSRLSNLSSSHEDLRAEHATVTTVKVAALQRNVSVLNHYIRTVELNHSSVLTEHSRAISEVERKASVLTQNIATTNRELQTQGERITAVDSRVSTLDGRVTSVHSTLSSKITTESQALQTQGERIAAIESKVSDLGSDITSVRSTLSSKIDHKASDLGTRIDDHIYEVQNKLGEQDRTDNVLDSRLRQVELKVNAASHVMPLGLVSLIFIFCFISLVTE